MPQVILDRRQADTGSAKPGPRRGRHRGSRPRRRGGRRLTARGHRKKTLALLALGGTLAGGGLAAIGLLAAGGGQFTQTGAVTLQPSAVASMPGAGTAEGAGSAVPPDSQPRYVIAPGPGSTAAPSKKPARKAKPAMSPTTTTPTPSATSPSAQSSPTASAPTHSASPAPKPTQPAPPSASPPAVGSATCGNPVFTTTDQFGAYNAAPYVVTNDMWNPSGANATQTLSVCSPSNWYVTASMDNGNGGVKTYPNVHRDFSSLPISSLKSVTSSFSESGAGTGTYEAAYDIWLNAIANPSAGSDEVMIWNDNHGQIPGGSPQGTVTFDGRAYTVWKGNGNYVAFVANSTFTAGTINLLDFFQYLIGKGWIPANSTLVEVDYGVELVNTNGAQEKFSFGNFSVDAS